MTYFKKGFMPALAIVLAFSMTSFPVQAQLSPGSGFEGSPARDSADGSVLGKDFRQKRTQDREQYRSGLTDLMTADRLENQQKVAEEIKARQDAIEQQVQDTLAQPSDYGTRLEALKQPPPTGLVNPDGTPYVAPQAASTPTGTQPLPAPIYQNPIAPVGRGLDGATPVLQ